MRERAPETNTARERFSRQLRKTRRWQLILLPLFAALLAPLTAFLWFAFTKPVEQAKPPLSLRKDASALTVRVGGDIMLAGNMADQIANQGPDFPFRHISEFLAAADFSYAGLATALSDEGSPLPGKPLTLVAEPSAVESLALSGLSLVGLASAHMMDYDTPALKQTISLLSGAGLGYMGAGEDAAAAAKPYTINQAGLRVALLDFCANADIYYSNQYPKTLAAGENEAGVANLNPEAVLTAISDARHDHDLVVLNLHWGEESSYLPTSSQRELAHRLIDGGADIIVGLHSDSLQGVEAYNNGLIVYSLGNLVNAQNSSQQAREGAVLELELTDLGWKNARMYPLLLSEQGQPALASGRKASDLMARLRSISASFSVNLTPEGDNLKVSQ